MVHQLRANAGERVRPGEAGAHGVTLVAPAGRSLAVELRGGSPGRSRGAEFLHTVAGAGVAAQGRRDSLGSWVPAGFLVLHDLLPLLPPRALVSTPQQMRPCSCRDLFYFDFQLVRGRILVVEIWGVLVINYLYKLAFLMICT